MNEQISFVKLRIISFFFLILFVMVFVFLFRWQIIDAKEYEQMATERIRNVEIPALRGSIYASDGTTLAYSERRFDIFAYINEIEDAERYNKQTRDEYLTKVSAIIGIEKEELSKLLDSGPKWVKIASKLSFDQKQQVVNLKRDNEPELPLEGNFVEYTSSRLYPEKMLASNLVGFTGFNLKGDLVGVSGIESRWEESLKALEGFKREQVDSYGNTIAILDFKPVEEKRGIDIYLTIDLKLQRILEQRLKESVERYRAESGAAVLMDPKTGKIMAISNYPTFDPNEYTKVTNGESFSNRAVVVPYEFGSIGKIFTVAAALDMDKVKQDSIILENGHAGCEFFINKDEEQCKFNPSICRVCTFDKRPQPKMTVAEGLIKSDNIALYHTAEVLGSDNLYDYLKKFKMGDKSNIEFDESAGVLKDKSQWNISDLVTYSYGHGYQGTLVQLTAGVAAVANDGKLMQPYIISKFVEPDGTEKIVKPEAVAQPIKPETAKIVGNILAQVYKNNILERYNRDLLNYSIAMKSGTALIPYKDRAGYSDEINTTYVGYDLSDEKSFVLSVWLNKPKAGTLASQNARVLWYDIFRDVKDYIGVPRTK